MTEFEKTVGFKERASGNLERGCRITGTIRGSGLLMVAGSIEGTVALVGGITIKEGGTIRGNVEVNSADIAGVLEGDLGAEDATVRQSGRVVGDVRAKRMSIEDGGIISGCLEMVVDLPEALFDTEGNSENTDA